MWCMLLCVSEVLLFRAFLNYLVSCGRTAFHTFLACRYHSMNHVKADRNSLTCYINLSPHFVQRLGIQEVQTFKSIPNILIVLCRTGLPQLGHLRVRQYPPIKNVKMINGIKKYCVIYSVPSNKMDTLIIQINIAILYFDLKVNFISHTVSLLPKFIVFCD